MLKKDFIFALCDAFGLSGQERQACEAAAAYLKEFSRVEFDHQNLYAYHDGKTGGEKRLLLEAHMDEVGLVVTKVCDSGFLRVANVGGADRRSLYGAEVMVFGRRQVYGAVAAQSPHLLKKEDRDKYPEMDQYMIDTGLTGEKARELIAPGDAVVPVVACRELLGGQFTGKALDNRIGAAAAIFAFERLCRENTDMPVTLLLSSKEEVGHHGAKAGAFRADPTDAVVVDVSFGYTPDSPRNKCGDVGKGPMIGVAPILTHAGTQKLIALAKEKEIPYQLEVMASSTGTNADEIVTTRSGVRTVLVSIPIKFMHSAVETACFDDIEATARLMAEYALSL